MDKSFFGQGFEVGTASFILVLFVGACAVFKLVKRDTERAVVLYAGIVASFLVLYVFQALRLAFGQGFASLGVLSGLTSTVFGGWYALGAFAAVIAFIAVAALLFLPLSRRLRIFYWVLLVLSALGVFVVNDPRVWIAAALVFLGLAIFESSRRAPSGTGFKGSLSHLAWLPLLICVIAGLMFWKGSSVADPAVAKLGASYADAPSLSWQGTLDVGAGAIKGAPLFGVGPNRFSQASFLDNKPGDVNATDVLEPRIQAQGWSTLSTFVVTEGLVGTVLWILLFVFFGIAAARALKRLPEDPQSRFVVVSSLASAVFLWVMADRCRLCRTCSCSMPSSCPASSLASAAAAGSLNAFEIAPVQGTRALHVSRQRRRRDSYRSSSSPGHWSMRRMPLALAYFASGPGTAHRRFADWIRSKPTPTSATAEKWNSSDIFLQARAEAGIAQASNLVSALNAQSSASTSQAVLGQAANTLNASVNYALGAIKLDPSNYYNYVSEARVASAAARLQIPNAYDTAGRRRLYVGDRPQSEQNPSLYSVAGTAPGLGKQAR